MVMLVGTIAVAAVVAVAAVAPPGTGTGIGLVGTGLHWFWDLGHPKNPGVLFFGGSEAPQAARRGHKSL